jgi:hypothetical protein
MTCTPLAEGGFVRKSMVPSRLGSGLGASNSDRPSDYSDRLEPRVRERR